MARPAFARKIAQDYVLDIIQKNQPISLYKLAKMLRYSYAGARNYAQELERKKLIRSEIVLNDEKTRALRVFFINI